MKYVYLTMPVLFALSACGEDVFGSFDQKPETEPVEAVAAAPVAPVEKPADPVSDAPPPPKTAKTVEQFDTTTKAERVEAKKAAQDTAGDQLLGRTITSLGSPTEPGIWMKTPLVSAPAKGRVENPANGQSVAVDLIPMGGAAEGGSQLSLAAFRLIGAPLTDLPELVVYRDGGAG